MSNERPKETRQDDYKVVRIHKGKFGKKVKENPELEEFDMPKRMPGRSFTG